MRSTNVREALEVLEEIAGTHGFGWWSAGSMAFADEQEVWIVELLGCHHWVAARVPDDAYYVQPNMLRIRQVDLADRENFRGSADLAEFAESIGRYDPTEGPLDVAWAYGDRTELDGYWNTNRLWRAIDLLSPSLGLSPDAPYPDRPVFAVPDSLLTKEDLMMVARDHYEGTDLDESMDYTLGSPHIVDDTRPICTSYTDYSAVWQLRGWLPDAVGGAIWLAPSHPCSSAYVPFHAGVTDVPDSWSDVSDRSAFNAFWSVSSSLDGEGLVDGDNRFHHYYPLVQSTLGAFEEVELAAQSEVESTATTLWLESPDRAEAFLTETSSARAEEARRLALDLADRMP